MFIKKLILGLVCLGTLALGSTAGSFLENAISARSLALGNTGAALNDGSASYLNPAAVKTTDTRQSYQIMQGQVFNEVNYFAFNFAQNSFSALDLGVGFSFLNSGVDGLLGATYDNITRTAAYTGETFGYSGRAYVFTLGKETMPGLYAGANLKLLQELLQDQNSSGLGLDAGLVWRGSKLQLGLSFINLIAPQLNWSSGWTEDLNLRMLLGVSCKIFENWGLYTDIEKNGERPLYYSLGSEYILFKTVALRLGWNPDQISAGTGLRYKNFAIDYAYILNEDSEIGSSHFISIAYLLDNNKELERLARAELERRQLLDAIEAEKQRLELAARTETASANTAEETKAVSLNTEATAEITPLPVNNTEVLETAVIDTANAGLDPVAPVAEEITSEKEATVNIIEESPDAFYDYRIALISARYYYQTDKLQSRIYLDNTGNQALSLNATFRLLDSQNQTLLEDDSLKAEIEPGGTEVFHVLYEAPLPAGIYYLEVTTGQPDITKYQKEEYIKRN